MNTALFLALVLLSLALAEVVYQGFRWVAARDTDELRRRLRQVGQPEAGIQLLRRRRLARSPMLDDALAAIGPLVRLARLLEQADIDWTVARFLAYSLLYGMVGALITALVTGAVLFAISVGVAVLFVPLVAVLHGRDTRSRRISEQLPEALDMVARSLRAGHALPSAFKLVAQEMSAPIAVEFGKVFEQQNLGIPFEDAAVEMAHRVPGNTDLAIFAVNVVIQRETGGNLVESLERIAEVLRERERFYGKLRALTAEGRVSAVILGSLPFAVAVVLMFVNRAYVRELSHGEGLYLLVAGLVLWAFGILWLRSMSRVEY